MKKSNLKIEEFIELKLTRESMIKLRGGESPTDPINPPVPPPGK
jgi:hypothetical protein